MLKNDKEETSKLQEKCTGIYAREVKGLRSKSNNNLYADKSPEKYDFYTMQPLLARREVESLALVDPPPCVSASH